MPSTIRFWNASASSLPFRLAVRMMLSVDAVPMIEAEKVCSWLVRIVPATVIGSSRS